MKHRRMLVPLCPVAAALVLGSAGCTRSPTPNAPTAADDDEHAVVDRVGDGDSLRLADGRELRLLQIDAPELHGDCYGRAALRALRRLIPPGTRIRIVADPRLDRRDRYKRLLRYAFLGRRNVGVELVRAGAASPYFFQNRRGRYAAELLEAAAEARAAERGFWKACPGARLDPGTGSVTGSQLNVGRAVTPEALGPAAIDWSSDTFLASGRRHARRLAERRADSRSR